MDLGKSKGYIYMCFTEMPHLSVRLFPLLTLSLFVTHSLSGLQGGVGEFDPGAAAEGEQSHRPSGPQTDR